MKVLYPDPLIDVPPTIILPVEFEPIYSFNTSIAQGHRIPLLFNEPGYFTIDLFSHLADANGWLRAGLIAQYILTPREPAIKLSRRLYFGRTVLSLEGLNYPWYMELWAYQWVQDYDLVIEARSAPPLQTVVVQGGPIFLGDDPLLIDDDEIIL